jgi:predicted phosphodiesterase
VITHIGGYPKRYKPGIKKYLQTLPTDLFICGHSHILKVMYDQDLKLLHMNPGAAGKEGFHQIRTLLRFSITEKRIHDLEVIEMKRW